MNTSVEFARDGFKKRIVFTPQNVLYFTSTTKPDISDLVGFNYIGSNSGCYVYSAEKKLDLVDLEKHGFQGIQFALNAETKLVFEI